MTCSSRTVLPSEEEQATCGRKVLPPVVKLVKSKEGTQITEVNVQETAIPVEPVERTSIALSHHVEEPSRLKPHNIPSSIRLITSFNGIVEDRSLNAGPSTFQRILCVQCLLHCFKEAFYGFLR